MGDNNGWVSSVQQTMRGSGPLAPKVAQAVRQANAPQANAQAIAQTQTAAADVRFEQMIVNIERFVLVEAINEMMELGWKNLKTDDIGVGMSRERRTSTLYDIYVTQFSFIGSEAAGIRPTLRSLKNQTNVDSSDKVLVSKMKEIMKSGQDAEDAHASYLLASRDPKDLGTYMSILERSLAIILLGKIQRQILDVPISNWVLAGTVQSAIASLNAGEQDRVQRERLLRKIYYDSGQNLDIVVDQYRAILRKAKNGH